MGAARGPLLLLRNRFFLPKPPQNFQLSPPFGTAHVLLKHTGGLFLPLFLLFVTNKSVFLKGFSLVFFKGEPAENSTLTIQFFFSADSASRFGFWHLEVVLEPKNSFDFSHGFKKNAATFFLQLDGYFGVF